MKFLINFATRSRPDKEALKQNPTHILWLDCSVWAIEDPMKVFDEIHDKGYYFWTSGYNCAQTCSDRCLDYFGVTRDEAEKMNEASTSMFGLNLRTEEGNEFVRRFLQAAKDDVFKGSREHDGQSSDPRFLFHRQDQSAASIIANQMGMNITPPNILSSYYHGGQPQNKSVVFVMRGM